MATPRDDVVPSRGIDHVLVASHRRSGTHLTIDSILNNFESFQFSGRMRQLNLDATMRGPKPLAKLRNELSLGPRVIKTHACSDMAAYFSLNMASAEELNGLLSEARRIYVHRDGRDVMVSLYHYAAGISGRNAVGAFSQFVREANDFDEGFGSDRSRPAYWAFHVDQWCDEPDVLLLSYESLSSDVGGQLRRIATHIDHPLPNRVTDVRLGPRGRWRVRVNRLGQRLWIVRRPLVRTSVEFHRGRIGDWVELFNGGDRRYFNEEAGVTNLRLGYGTGDT